MNQPPGETEQENDEKCEDVRRATVRQTKGLAAYLMISCAAVLTAIILLWPPVESPSGPPVRESAADTAMVALEKAAVEQPGPAEEESARVTSPAPEKEEEVADRSPGATQGWRTLLLVVLAGALGSLVHAIKSLGTFVGNRKLIQSWILWYIMIPFVGAPLALILYFVLSGGLILLAGSSEVNPCGAVAIGALTGLFSKSATDKLSDIFRTLFKTSEREGDEARKDKLAKLVPVSEVMIPAHCITSYTLQADEGEGETMITGEEKAKINDLLKLVSPVVTRIPILTKDRAVKYVIHASMLYKFFTKKWSKMGEKFDSEALTLHGLLEYKGMKDLIVDTLVFVDCEAMITEAKEKMDKTRNCQDVIVTKNGGRDEPVQGWLTNIDIQKHTEA